MSPTDRGRRRSLAVPGTCAAHKLLPPDSEQQHGHNYNQLIKPSDATHRVCFSCQRINANNYIDYNILTSENDSFDSLRRNDSLNIQNLSLYDIIETKKRLTKKRRRRRPEQSDILNLPPKAPPPPPSNGAPRKNRKLFTNHYYENSTSFVLKSNHHHLLSSPTIIPKSRSSYYFVLLLSLFILSITETEKSLFTSPILQTSAATSSNTYQYGVSSGGGGAITANKNSGQFHISQLCSPRSPFPITRRIEGASLSAGPADSDMNCTITFRTKSAQQHFVIRFEELKLSCDDHLVLFDGDLDYGQPSIKDFSCRDNMASVPTIKTTGTFLTLRYSSDGVAKMNDGFRLVATAVFDMTLSDCPAEYVFCRSQLCISRSLFCDGINHCLDNSDEIGCHGADDSPIELPYALGFFVMLILVISTGVIVCIILHCRRSDSAAAGHIAAMRAAGMPPNAANTYAAQYQQHLQRAFAGMHPHQQHGGQPLHASSSFMFPGVNCFMAPGGGGGAMANPGGGPQYQQFFQAASPYVTPQHHATPHQQQQHHIIATLPRGYSTLPLNMLRAGGGGGNLQPQTILATKAAGGEMIPTSQPGEYVMMTGLAAGPPPPLMATGHMIAAMPVAAPPPVVSSAGDVGNSMQHHQHNHQQARLANSQSILSSSTTATTTIAQHQQAATGNNRSQQQARQQQQQQQMRSPPSSSNASTTNQATQRDGGTQRANSQSQ